jgi:hypothetical protein
MGKKYCYCIAADPLEMTYENRYCYHIKSKPTGDGVRKDSIPLS